MDRWQNRVAVVTGASSGIGEAIAKDLVKAGLRVVALARRQDDLNKNRSKLPADLRQRYFVRKCDVSNDAEVKTSFDWIENILGGTDILVNNAGALVPGNLLELESSLIDEILGVNLKGLISCTQAAFQSMKARSFDGHIVHINSIVGHKVNDSTSSQNIYPVSKFAVTATNEVVRIELRNLGTKIKTTSVSPGLVRTNIVSDDVFNKIGIYLNPEDVSQAVMFALSTPPHVQIHEITLKVVGEKF